MKTKLCRLSLLAAVAIVSLAVRADYLYWQVSLTTPLEGFDYARALYTDDLSLGGTVMELYNEGGSLGTDKSFTITPNQETGAVYAYSAGFDRNDLSNYIIIEMWDHGEVTDQLLAQVIVESSAWYQHSYKDMQHGGETPLMIRNAPEPSSGLMLLVGWGLLALRRRKTV